MTNLHSLSTGFFCVELPEGATQFRLTAYGYAVRLKDNTIKHVFLWYNGHIIYSILGMASDIGESVAVELVEHWSQQLGGLYYRDYQDAEYFCDTAVASLHSRIRSLGHKPENVLIVKHQ